MKNIIRRAAAGLAAAMLALTIPTAAAVDGMAVEIGGGDGSDMGRVALQWDWNKRWAAGQEWHIGGYWDLGLGYWKRDARPGQNSNLTEIGFTPVFRLQRNDLKGFYGEGAIGIHFLSDTHLGDKRFSTSFQFGDHLGVGYRFGAKSAWDIAYHYQHLSNGSIKKPNDGINFHQIRAQYHF